jgi:hypothetical protein
MNGNANIQYLTNKQVDKTKWDHCIDNATNGLIYAYSFYLDHMAKRWDALVLNDYEAVMPLTWNRKYGICYIYQPFLTAQLGLFGKNISDQLLESFFNAVPRRFRYWDFYINHSNVFPSLKYELYQRRNFVLDLSKPYEELYAAYRENIKRNIKKALQIGCTVSKDFEVKKVIALAVEQIRSYTKESSENVERFDKLYHFLHQKKMAVTYGILSAKKELIASCVFFFSHNRAYYILVGNHPDGRTVGASHLLIDAFIKDHAGKKMILDFEGSDIRNLAFFYSSFGAKEELFAGIKLNRLPRLLRLLKR